MTARWLLNPRFLFLIPLTLVLVIAVACGEDATPLPTPTPGLSAQDVKQIVSEALQEQPSPLGADEVKAIVEEALPTATPIPGSVMAEPIQGSVVPMSGYVTPIGWDPHGSFEFIDIHASSAMFNQLVEYNPLNPTEIIGDMAESWSVSSDGGSYTFEIIQGVKWSDGQPVTIDDIVFSINRIIDPDASRPMAGNLRPYVKNVERVSDDSVTVNLTFPSEAFLKLLALDYMKMVPQHVYDGQVDTSVFANMVGSGPFVGSSFQTGVGWELDKNTDYFKDGLPYFDGIRVIVITDQGTEAAAFKTDQVLMSGSCPTQQLEDDYAKLFADESFSAKYDLYDCGDGGEAISVNVNVAPYNDERVRRAIFLALDRQEFAEGFGLGRWLVGRVMSPKNVYALPEDEILSLPGYRQLAGKKHPADIEEAQKLMAEAGYADGFSDTFIVPLAGFFPDASILVKDQLKRYLNIDITLLVEAPGVMMGKLFSKDYSIGFLGYAPLVYDPDDRLRAVYTEGGGARNFAGWSDSRVEELFKEQQVERDPDRRRQINHEIQRIILNGAPGRFELVWKPFGPIVSKRIRTKAGSYVPAGTIQMAFKHEHEWLGPK